MSSNFPELVFNETEDFTADRLNKAMQVLDQRLRALEPFTPSWEAAVNELRAVGLSRLNDAILPAYQRIQLLSEMGFLFAGSDSSVALVQNQSATFNINDETERSLFTPTPFLALTRSSTTADYAIAQLVSYDNDTGDLMVLVKSITGNPGPHTDWQIGALAANTAAAMEYFAQIDAARNQANAAKAATAADRVQTGLDAAAAQAAKIAAQQAATNIGWWDPALYATKVDLANLVNAAPEQLNTINELAAALGNDANFSASITASLGARLRVDANNQGLTSTQQENGRTNLGLGDVATKSAATVAELRAGNTNKVVMNDQAWAAAGWVDLGNSGGGTLNIDCNLGVKFRVVLTGNVTVSFVNARDGQGVDVIFVQDATGGRTVSWNSNVRFPNGTVPTVATAANGWALVYTGVYSSTHAQWLGAGWKNS